MVQMPSVDINEEEKQRQKKTTDYSGGILHRFSRYLLSALQVDYKSALKYVYYTH